jgi:TP901 family phage tail tape measure protein
MAVLSAEMIVKLVDQVTGPANKAARSLRNLQNVGGVQGVSNKLSSMLEKNSAALEKARGGIVDAMGGFFALKAAIAGPVEAAMNFQSAMADVRKVVNFPTPKAFTDFQQQLLDMSKTIPTSVEGLAQIAANAGQQGIPDKDILRFTEDAAKVGVAFDISADQASAAMAHLMTGLGLNIDQVVSLTDAMNNLSNNQASSASEILDVVTRIGGQAKQFGFTAEQVAAFGSAMVSAGAETDVAATSFRNMGNALTKGASVTKRQREAYEALGLSATDVAKRMQKDAVGTTLDVMERIAKLPADQRNSVATNLFGNEARALPTLLTNLPLLRESLGMVADQADYAGSSFKEYEIRSKTFANSLQLFKNRLTALGITIGNALMPPLTDLMDKLSPIIDGFAKWSAEHPALIAGILGAAGSLIAFKMAMSTLSFVGLIGTNGALSILAGTFKTIAKYAGAAKEAVALQTALAAMDGAKMTGFDKLVSGLTGMALAAPGVAAVSSALGAIGGAIAAISLPGLFAAGVAIAGIAAAGYVIWSKWDAITSLVGGFASELGERLQPAIQKLQPILEPFQHAWEAIAGAIGSARDAIGNWVGSLMSALAPQPMDDRTKDAWHFLGVKYADAIVDGFTEALKKLWELVSNIPGQIASYFSNIHISVPIDWHIFGWGGGQPATGSVGPRNPLPSGTTGMTPPHRANGGPVWRGGSFLVGERGPETFMPKSSGSIVPAGAASPSVVVHITMNGVVGDAREIARAVSERATAELGRALRGLHSDAGVRY